MKVLILSHDPKFKGGVANYTNLLVSKLSGRIFFDRMFIGRRLRNSNWFLRYIFFPVHDCLKLYKKVTFNNYNLVHLNPSLDIKSLLRDGFFLIVLKVSRQKNILVFWRGWNLSLAEIIISKIFFRWAFQKIYGNVSLVLTLSHSIRNSLIKIGIDKNKIHITKTMFDGRQFSGICRFNFKTYVKIIFLSRLSIEKGVYELLEGFRLVNNKYKSTKLYIAGDGPERQNMENWIRKHNLTQNVFFTGYLRGEKKAKFLEESDIFVLPSYSEGCPNALLEALGAGLAIIATPVGAIPEVIINDINGRLLNKNTATEIAEAIFKFIENKEYTLRIRQNNKIEAWTKYEANIISSEIERYYREIVCSN